MALIDCPKCGHKVLSVASTCPECGFSLSEQRKRESHSSRVAHCRHCHREIAVTSKLCPHCGESRPVPKRPKWVILVIVVAAIVAAVLFIPWGRMQQAGREQEEPAPTIDSAPVTPDTVPAPVIRPLVTERLQQPPPPSATQTVTRWATDWANVREGRGIGYDIVGQVALGEQIEVADLQAGWWALYVAGRRVGYVSASLLAAEPPGAQPDTGGTPR